jgi:gluconate kinase
MANSVEITVCVIALTPNDYNDLPPEVKTKVDALKPSFDFAISGRPYEASPDEWKPFDPTVPIRQYFTDADLTATFLSGDLYDDKKSLDVLRDTQLYIIDPFVLAHNKKKEWLRQVQTTIYTADEKVFKAFCIILPSALPQALRDEITTMCTTSLGNLYLIRKRDTYEWQVENADRFQTYLTRLARKLGPTDANYDSLQVIQAMLQAFARDPGLKSAPNLANKR